MVAKHISAVVLILVGYSFCFGQHEVRSKEDLLIQLNKDEKLLKDCEQKFTDKYVAKFGTKPMKISLHCGPGGPVSLAKPRYPEHARKLRIRGEIVVEAIVDENGKVRAAKVLQGNRIFATESLTAIYSSEFRQIIACNDKPVVFRRTVRYNFFPNM